MYWIPAFQDVAQVAEMASFDWSRLLRPNVMVFLIPIAAIVVGGIVALAKMLIVHRERMALIEQGLHPDHPPEEEEPPEEDPAFQATYVPET